MSTTQLITTIDMYEATDTTRILVQSFSFIYIIVTVLLLYSETKVCSTTTGHSKGNIDNSEKVKVNALCQTG